MIREQAPYRVGVRNIRIIRQPKGLTEGSERIASTNVRGQYCEFVHLAHPPHPIVAGLAVGLMRTWEGDWRWRVKVHPHQAALNEEASTPSHLKRDDSD
jgi:hypothetical protein